MSAFVRTGWGYETGGEARPCETCGEQVTIFVLVRRQAMGEGERLRVCNKCARALDS